MNSPDKSAQGKKEMKLAVVGSGGTSVSSSILRGRLEGGTPKRDAGHGGSWAMFACSPIC
jgi:hypothetical protein